MTFGCVFLSAAVTLDYRLAVGGVAYLAAFLVSAAKPSAVLVALGTAHALAGLVAVYVAASVSRPLEARLAAAFGLPDKPRRRSLRSDRSE